MVTAGREHGAAADRNAPRRRLAHVIPVAPAVQRAARAELTPLWDELARRLGASDRPVTAVTLRGLDERQRAGVADLLGRERLVPSTCRVPVGALVCALGLEGDDELRRLVDELRGPIVSRAEHRRHQRAEREALWAWLAGEAERLGAPGWAAGLRAAGVPGGDVGGHRERLEAAVAVVQRTVEGDDQVSLAVLAATAVGDPHALDPATALAPLVLGALAERLGLATPRSAEEARSVWAAAGVVADELSSRVLVLGLRPERADSPLGTCLAALADAGEPAAVTLAQLRRWRVAPLASEVRVVENPSVLAEAARTGGGEAAERPPLVCTSGWPNVAVMTLLRQLAAAGVRLRCHADFDPPGVLMVRHLVERVGAEPWRMDAADYLAAADRSRLAFAGSVADTPWDTGLAGAMRTRRRAVFEEDVASALLGRHCHTSFVG